MKKALTSVLLSLILTLTASGCAPELYERLLISAIGVDRTATGCRVTVLASETTEDGGQSTFSGEGDTVPEALSQIALESGRTPLYSHNAAILFGMQCAESGIAEQLDFFIRHYDSRPPKFSSQKIPPKASCYRRISPPNASCSFQTAQNTAGPRQT